MVAIVDRRLALATLAVAPSWPGRPSLMEAVDLICRSTPRDLRLAVQETGCFLYRGEDSTDGPSWLCPEPDLLVDGTYDVAGNTVTFTPALPTREPVIQDSFVLDNGGAGLEPGSTYNIRLGPNTWSFWLRSS